ncbi:putative aldouronate transport system substrate-binding protein [Paenibacillus sp. UNCCL117]|uniref:extracellular solute-binding protein n=1 Tax=unclassified Paenibacillus TaxID=185978 RepID=UPI00087FDC27|nr:MULTISPECIES: extracellular solute-binding protein [unclassified Paenibacillus]SDE40338.1 putative aldouronate transport system substrate-binding protein [Paenibacillus sp. cl123]SFW65324.1 putative aldouronate transport system substrate-binding protein [Paenibacillus sp. UNCCL117]
MKNWTTRLGSVALCTSLVAGCSGTASPPPSANGETPQGSEKTKNTFTMLMVDHPNWPYNKDWVVWKWIEEKTGATFQVQLPSGELKDTINLNVASGNMPDITFFTGRADADKFGQQGVLANILDYIDSMPNLKKWLEKYPGIAKSSLAANGAMYMLPNEGFGETNRLIWMYREDVFKKHNLNPPSNYEELIEVSKKLKELYPGSYPFSFRTGPRLAILDYASAQFGTHSGFFLDEKTGKLRYGPTEDGYKKMVEMFHRFHKEGIMPPDWLTVNVQQWQNMVSTDKSFMIFDYIGRLDLFNIPMQKTNPEFKLAFMTPPEGVPGFKVNPYIHFIESGMTISARSGKIKEALQAYDWFYSEEAKTLLSWGKDNEIYTNENGQRKLKPDYLDVTDVRKKTGLATNGAYTWFDYDAHLAPATPGQREAYDQARKHDSVFRVKPQYNESELTTVSMLQSAVDKHREEQITRFILGERSLDQWDQYVAEAKKLGLDELTKLTQTAYDRLR